MGLPGNFSLPILFVTLLICGASTAQDLPEASSPHGFWDRANKMLFASHATLEALDFGITHHNLSDGGRELDPMAKALCERGTAGQLVFFGGRMAGVVASVICCTEPDTTNWSALFRSTPAAIPHTE